MSQAMTETIFLFRRLCVLIQRYNAVHDSFVKEEEVRFIQAWFLFTYNTA